MREGLPSPRVVPCLVLLLAGAASASSRCGGTGRVLVVYDSVDNHTKQMAEALAEGAQSVGAEVAIARVGSAAAVFPAAANVDAVALGSPVHYANPSSATLQWLVEGLGPGWGNGTFDNVPASVFATGGGIH